MAPGWVCCCGPPFSPRSDHDGFCKCRRALENRAKHRLGELAGGRVLLAGMIGTDQQRLAFARAMLRVVSEHKPDRRAILPRSRRIPR